jgi:hypothetical protein
MIAALALAAAVAAPIFQFHTDEFWLNLHHFLYVLGRAEAKTADSSRDAVRGAPADEERGLATLSAPEQQIWRDAVQHYAAGISLKDAVFDEPLAKAAHALVAAGTDPELAVGGADGLDPAIAAILNRAAPVYRKAWWAAHRAANERWRATVQALVGQHGDTVLAFITRAYGMKWPDGGYPVHVSAYANWAGAYSTSGNLLVLSSLDGGTQGLQGLETVFHEGMHQWDDAMIALVRDRARARGVRLPPNLSHAMIFFTAGEAVRHAVPSHVPYADAAGVWDRGFTVFRQPLIDVWKPFLDGRGTRDEALAALVAAVGR